MASSHPALLIIESDFERLTALAAQNPSPAAVLLEEELQRAAVMTPQEAPPDLVIMNSVVTFRDL